MNQETLTLVPATEAHTHALVDLLQAQDERFSRIDGRLRPVRSRSTLETIISAHSGIVALNARGDVRGYVQPAIWELDATSLLRAFLTARNGVFHTLALPDPQDNDAHEVLVALLTQLSLFWNHHLSTGDLFRWPSHDTAWIEDTLVKQEFRLDSVCALLPLVSETSVVKDISELSSTSVTLRSARQSDEQALLALFDEELRFHQAHTPFVRKGPGVLEAFQRKLYRLWSGQPVSEGAPFVIVAVAGESVIGMAENTLLEITDTDEPGFLPPGRYGCIDNVCVREEWRGQKVGHQLTHASLATWTAAKLWLQGYVLWFNPDNPLAARFWTKQGFVPLWTTYQRLHTLGEVI